MPTQSLLGAAAPAASLALLLKDVAGCCGHETSRLCVWQVPALPRSVLLSFEALMVFQLEDLEICSTSRKKHQGTNGSLQAMGISSSKQPSLEAEILESRRVW